MKKLVQYVKENPVKSGLIAVGVITVTTVTVMAVSGKLPCFTGVCQNSSETIVEAISAS